MTTQQSAGDEISVYWQTGCTACLRTKEFLTRHNVPFRSRNVLEDPAAFGELTRFGLRQVPIVTRGDQWANGQVLTDVARIVGIVLDRQGILPVPELRRRLDAVLAAAERFAAQIPADHLQTKLPSRPRSYANLVYHIFNIADAFVEHGEGIPLVYESYDRSAPPDRQSNEDLVAYGNHVQRRLANWFEGPGKRADFNARADVYYGEQTLHQFLERTTWHSGQHTRQLTWVLSDILRIPPHGPLPPSTFEGLPMPVKVWDDEDAR